MSTGPRSRPEEASGNGTAAGGRIAGAVAVLRRVARASMWLAGGALFGGIALWWALREALGPREGRAVVLAIAAAALLAPPVLLALFAVALRGLADLPRRLREAPAAVSGRAGEIRRRAAAVAEARRRGVLSGLRAIVRLWWTAASSREVLEILSPAAALLTPAMLVATAVAGVAAVAEIVLGVAAVLLLAP